MNLKMSFAMLTGIFGVLLTILALQDQVAGEWTTIGQSVTAVIVMISLLAFVIVAITKG